MLDVSSLLLKSHRHEVLSTPGLALFLLPFATLLHTQFAWAAPTCAAKAARDVVIVLDVGHIARKPGVPCHLGIRCYWGGTSARGVPEYDFNLKLARRIGEELVSAGFSSTHVMVTRTDGTAGLHERTDRAGAMNADLFVSIHHDAVGDKYVKPWLYNGERHFYYDDAKGFSLHVSPNNVRYGQSLAFAKLLADQLMERGLMFNTVHVPSNPVGARVPFIDASRGIYRRDGRGGLAVLNRAGMPAVLLEAGVIVNRDEELLVSTPDYQAKIAGAVTQAARTFCAAGAAPVDIPYRVFDVAPDDVLNVRSGPNASFPIVGKIPPTGRGVRITGGCSGRWCPVSYRDIQGWVNRRFLTGD